MKIELKNVMFSEAMSEETNAFTADLYINGKKVGYCKNTGQGGCTDYHGDYSSNDATTKRNNALITEAEAYCKALPKTKWKQMEFAQSLESVIDDLLENWLEAKEVKKFEKKMLTCILVGSADDNRNQYSYYNFKRPLSDFTPKQLQDSISRIKTNLKAGQVILNTNLEVLGVNV